MSGRPGLDLIASPVREILSGRRDGRSQIATAIAAPAGAASWFTPADPIWTVHGSVATFVGGIRALLLQSLHPLALAGVEQFSTYRDDPFGRLQRTGAFIAATKFGSTRLAEQTVDAVTGLHRRVRGTAPDGRGFAASDPRLLQWVHCTLTDSMLAAYLGYGHDGPIDPDGYVANMSVVGRAMGAAQAPVQVAGLRAELRGFRAELTAGPATARMTAFVMRPPGLPAALRPGYAVLAAAAMDLLPARERALLGSATRGPIGRSTVRAGADVLLRTLQVALVESPARAAGERRLGLRPA